MAGINVGGAGIRVSGGGSSSGFNAADIPYTQIYKTNNTPESTALTINTPIKAVITTTRDTNNTSTHWTMPSSNRITYTGASHKALITLSVSGGAGIGGGLYRWRLYKNGAAVNSVIFGITQHLAVSQPRAVTLTILTSVVTADYFEIWVEEVVTGVSFLTDSCVFNAEFAGWL
jgi:hypothetical protein